MLCRIAKCIFLVSVAAVTCTAADKPTSLSDARSAVEVNLNTPEGKAYDERFGTDLIQHHLAPLRECKKSTGDDQRSFWILMKLGGDGVAKEILFYPETKMATCSRDPLFKEKFPPPPRPGYWVSIYMKN